MGALDLLTGAASLALGYQSQEDNVRMQRETNATNIQLARDQRDFYYQQWMRENAYNNPSAQMQRLLAAGLNPNLVYGDGGATMPSASMQDVSSARVQSPSVDPLLAAQIANLDANTQKTLGENERANEKQPLELDKLSADIKTMTENIGLIRSSVTLNRSLSAKSRAEANKLAFDLEKSIQSWPSELEILKAKEFMSTTDAEFYREKLSRDLENLSELTNLYMSQSNYNKEKIGIEKYKNSIDAARLGNEMVHEAHWYGIEGEKLKQNDQRIGLDRQRVATDISRAAAYISYLRRMETHLTVSEIEQGVKILSDLALSLSKMGRVTENVTVSRGADSKGNMFENTTKSYSRSRKPINKSKK